MNTENSVALAIDETGAGARAVGAFGGDVVGDDEGGYSGRFFDEDEYIVTYKRLWCWLPLSLHGRLLIPKEQSSI